MNHEELYNSFVALVEAGDEAAAKQFLIDHLNDFPEESRKEIAFAFFVDALKADGATSDVKQKGLALMKELSEAESALSDAVNSIDLKGQM